MEHYATHCPGYVLKMERDVTFGDLLAACRRLGELYPGSVFLPEYVVEGGIKWENAEWGAHHESDKSFRMRAEPDRYRAHADPDVVVYPLEAKEVSTYLKARGSAPPWKQGELQVFEAVLCETCGLRVKKRSYPKVRDVGW